MTAQIRTLTGALAALLAFLLVGCHRTDSQPAPKPPAAPLIFSGTGVVRAVKPAEHKIIIRHNEIPGYMPAMTMPFGVRDTNQLIALVTGDQVAFKLLVTESESWIEDLKPTGPHQLVVGQSASSPTATAAAGTNIDLMSVNFTNEFGQPIAFNDFKGQALGVTFFFTRCPLPEYCPRLMKNFAGASELLLHPAGRPTNWHFLAITFDPKFDTPTVLRDYAARYNYNSNHWSFLTGDPHYISELAHAVGVSYEPDGASFNHNFRTLVVNPAGELHTSFPIGGDLSELLAAEILKAIAGTNR